MNKAHENQNWKNFPSKDTPINETNLNKLDRSVDEIDNRVISLDTSKFDKTEAQNLVKNIELDKATGIFTISFYNGGKATIDTLLEKIAVNFDYDPETQQIILELDDGEKKYIDLSALITQHEFLDSDTIAFQLNSAGDVTAIVKEGSIEEKHLHPNYLADIKVESAKAEASATSAADSATKAESFAHGGTGTRDNEDTDNASYFYNKVKEIIENAGGIVPLGTIAFASLPTTDIVSGTMYNIEDAFTSDDRFVDGGDTYYGAGSNVYYTSDGKWDVLSAPAVYGVKGNKESTYRKGNVNLTPANIGAVSTTGATTNNTVAFTSNDSTDADAWSDVSVLTTGEKHSSLFNKVSTMFKNIRYLYKLMGTTDISAIGDGTASGAISELNSRLGSLFKLATVTVGNENITANTDIIWTKDISMEGYTPTALIGWANGASSAFYAFEMVIKEDHILSVKVRSSENVNLARMNVNILYVKT